MANDQLTKVTAINERLNKLGQKLGISATQTTDASGIIKFSVGFNSDLFYNNFLKKQIGQVPSVFQSTLKPINSVFEFLNTEIPLLSDYPDVFNPLNRDSNYNSISVLDVIAFASEKSSKSNEKVDVSLVSDILSFSKFITNLSPRGKIELGELTVDTLGIINTRPIKPDIHISIPESLPNGFKIPLFTNPVNTIFGVLQGENKDIFSYAPPKLSLNFPTAYSFTAPALGVLGIKGSVGAGIT